MSSPSVCLCDQKQLLDRLEATEASLDARLALHQASLSSSRQSQQTFYWVYAAATSPHSSPIRLRSPLEVC